MKLTLLIKKKEVTHLMLPNAFMFVLMYVFINEYNFIGIYFRIKHEEV